MKTSNLALSTALFAYCFAWPLSAVAADNAAMQSDVVRLEHGWAHIVYQVKDQSAQLDQIDALRKDAAQVAQHYPGHAEPLIWQGIITSEEAAIASVFTALGWAKDARALFEKAEKIDPNALDAAVPTSLGTLYYRVPGFPVGFGDNDKARQYLEHAVAIAPDGMDANYFYGDFLFQQGEYAKSAKYLKHALELPAHPDRPVWDAGRRAEIRALLAKAQRKLASAS